MQVIEVELETDLASLQAKPKPEEPAPKPALKEPPPPPPPAPERPQPVAAPEPEPKAEPVPEPEAKPEPEPEPVPVPKPPVAEKPAPKAEPDPKPEPPKAAAPRPKSKPKPPSQPEKAPEPEPEPKNDFASVLKTVRKLEKTAPKPAPEAKPEKTLQQQVAEALNRNRPTTPTPTLDNAISNSDLDAIRRQIEACWNLPAGARDAQSMTVEIRTLMNPDGRVRSASIVDTGRASRDNFYRSMAESALRAVLNPRCQPFRLPVEKYDEWRVLVLNFDPRGMF